jgi:hypothetical protein
MFLQWREPGTVHSVLHIRERSNLWVELCVQGTHNVQWRELGTAHSVLHIEI